MDIVLNLIRIHVIKLQVQDGIITAGGNKYAPFVSTSLQCKSFNEFYFGRVPLTNNFKSEVRQTFVSPLLFSS
jgi:hypothetical protein